MANVDIPPLSLYRRRQLAKGRRIKPSQADLERDYWDYLETIRLSTGNLLPHINYLCLVRLIQLGLVRNVITTNYDRYLQAVLDREMPGSWVLNPCPRRPGEPRLWDGDGYLTSTNARPLVSLWKVHGDLGFAKMDGCGHILKLPRFLIGHYTGQRNLRKLGIDSLHDALTPEAHEIADPSAWGPCSVEKYDRHLDYGRDRNLFTRERQAAIDTLMRGSKDTLLVVGLNMRPKYPEDLVDAILEVAHSGREVIYLLASKKRLTPQDSALLDRMEKAELLLTTINEVAKDAAIEVSFVGLLDQMAQLRPGLSQLRKAKLYADYDEWKEGGRWWVPDE